jgi:hypothetical protein
MVGSFSWGLIRLLQALDIEDRGSGDWSFGQIVPIVLLAAPLLTIFESFFEGMLLSLTVKYTLLMILAQQPSNTLSTALVQFHTAYSRVDNADTSSIQPLQERDHPDHNFYQDSSWTHSLIYLMVACAVGITFLLLMTSGFSFDQEFIRFLIPKSDVISYIPFYTTLTIWIFIMLSMLIEDIGCAQRNVLRSIAGMKRKTFMKCSRVFIFLLSVAGVLTALMVGSWIIVLPLFGTLATIYCALSIRVFSTTVRHGSVFA